MAEAERSVSDLHLYSAFRKQTSSGHWWSTYARPTSAQLSCHALDRKDTEVTEQEKQEHLLETLNETAALVAAELNVDRLVQAVIDAGVRLSGD